MAELTQYQRDILARTLLGEAAGEGSTGMEAVAHVIRNRAGSGQYPSDPAKVALQPKQFLAWNSGEGGNHLVNITGGDLYNKALAAVDAVFGGQSSDPTGGALQYWAPQGMPGGKDPYWAKGKDNRTAIGNHVFLSQGQAPAPLTPQTRFMDQVGTPNRSMGVMAAKPQGLGGMLSGLLSGGIGAVGNAFGTARGAVEGAIPQVAEAVMPMVMRPGPGTGKLLATMLMSPRKSDAQWAKQVGGTERNPITYDYARATPGDGRQVNGTDMAFMPESVQRSSRWNTGY